MLQSRTVFTIFCFLLLNITLFAGEEEFNVDRLPLGNPATKYSYCAVKLNRIFDSGMNQHISHENFTQKLGESRIILVGESHTNPEHHQVQFAVIKSLTEAGKKVCLALEMFNPEQNQALQNFVDEKYPASEFMDQTGWFDTWGYNYRMYQPIFEYARANKIPLFGVNAPRDLVSKIGRSGLTGLSKEESAKIPALDTTNVEHQFLIKTYFTGSDALHPKLFWNRYLAQSVWDAQMAEGAIEVARDNPETIVVLLAGSGHVAYNLGIGRILQKSGLPFASVLPVDVPREKEESLMEMMHKHRKKEKGEEKKMPPAMQKMMAVQADTLPHKIVVRSFADFLWGVPDTEGKPAYPTLGVRLGEKDSLGFEINNVFPETIAEENGIESGDFLISVDDQQFESLNELKEYLHNKNWDDPIRLTLLREEEQIKLEFNLEWNSKSND